VAEWFFRICSKPNSKPNPVLLMARAILPAQDHSLLVVLHKNGVLSLLYEKTFVDQALAPG